MHRAERVLLLCRLADDTHARRGELAALQLGDLDGRVLTIERAPSGEVIGPTKTRTARRLTLGPTSTDLWQASIEAWRARSGSDQLGPWLFSADPSHGSRLTTGGLGHWFAQLCEAAGMPEVTLHRLRHTVATVLVGRGQILQAQYRLGHADAHTTLRIYSHAQPCTTWTPPTPSTSCTGPEHPVRELGRTPHARRPALAQSDVHGNTGAHLPERSRAALVP